MSSTPVPREHGAYVVLLACWLLGLMTSTSVDFVPTILSLVVSLAVFAASEPARLVMVGRRSGRGAGAKRLSWLMALVAIAAASGIALAILRPQVLWLLPPAAAVSVLYLVLLSRRASMADLSFAGFAGLSLAAPLALLAASATWTPPQLVALWLFSAIFFGASAWCVRIRLVGPEGLRSATVAHVALVIVTIAFVALDALPMVALIAVVPAVIRFIWVITHVERYRRQPLKLIGVTETVLALLLVIVAFWF